jgi:hypothetical protein
VEKPWKEKCAIKKQQQNRQSTRKREENFGRLYVKKKKLKETLAENFNVR